MAISLLSIRFKQLYREILRIGFFRIIVLAGIGLLFFIYLYQQTSKLPNAAVISLPVLLLILILHTKRTDKLFLRINFNHFKWIFFAEYLSISLILLVFLLIHEFWFIALAFILLVGTVLQIDVKNHRSGYNTKLQKWIPTECFEWKSGIRKMLPFILTIWILGFLFSFFIGSVPISLAILGIVFLSFQEKNEPLQMVLAFEKKPSKFLSLKIKQQSAILSVISIPLLLHFQIFHYRLWYIPIIMLIAFCLLQAYAIVVKYAFYTPNRESSASQIYTAIGVIGLILGVFAPIILLLLWYFYLKAKRNLNFYLNDYH